MTVMSHTPVISKMALQALTELTGEPRPNVALLIMLKDALAYRLEKIDVAINALENKYGMPFDQFQTAGVEGRLPDSLSFEVETDYFEWDGLISRQKKLEEIYEWLG